MSNQSVFQKSIEPVIAQLYTYVMYIVIFLIVMLVVQYFLKKNARELIAKKKQKDKEIASAKAKFARDASRLKREQSSK